MLENGDAIKRCAHNLFSLFVQNFGQNAEVDYRPWRNIETLCLMVCRDVLLSQGISINSKNLHDLYDFVLLWTYMSLNIAAKSTAQIATKIAYLRSIDL